MGKISKKPLDKHATSLSPAVLEFVHKLNDASYAKLPHLLKHGWDRQWPYPRGDLMNWVGPLDRFDNILESFIRKYGLDHGPQTIPFGVDLLVEGTPGATKEKVIETFGADGDRALVELILDFSRLLVDKCANRNLYNSTDRLNDLLNTTSLSLLHKTLRLTVYLAKHYSERHGGGLETTLFKFYDYDHQRLRCLASPIAQNVSGAPRTPTSPSKITKSKSTGSRSRRTSSISNPNDFRNLLQDTTAAGTDASPKSNRDWRVWQNFAHVRVSWSPDPVEPKDATSPADTTSVLPSLSAPSTPTPLRRQTSANSKPFQADAQPSESVESPSMQELEFGPSDIEKLTIEEALGTCPATMPADVRYELLHKLRIAYGFLKGGKAPAALLATRILGIQVLGNVSTDTELVRNLLGKDQPSRKPQELIQQLVSLIHAPKGKEGQPGVSNYLRTVSMEAIAVLGRHKTFGQDIISTLGANSSNGLLLRLTQTAHQELAVDGDASDNEIDDDWRAAVFDLPRVVIDASGHSGRNSEAVFSTAFMRTFVKCLRSTTAKAMRAHVHMLDFIKLFFHHFKDGLPILMQVDTFEIISTLLRDLAEDAWQRFSAGNGIPAPFKTKLTDYDIPYMHRQVIRSIIDLINDVCEHHGAHADRAARSLIDTQSLLVAFKLILDKFHAFGTLTWSDVVKALTSFLNNEPTCYTVIAEAGLIESFINTVTGSTSPETDLNSTTISSASRQLVSSIPSSMEAILHTAGMFQAICLTSAGFELFKSSGLIEAFFQIFESPPHVRAMKDLRALGAVFDELVRHHESLKPIVLSAIVVMISRVRYISRAMAGDYGAGPILWIATSADDSQISGGVEAFQQEVIPPIREPAQITVELPTGKVLAFEDPKHNGLRSQYPQNEDAYGLTASDYLKPALGFLVNFFRSQTLCSTFMEAGGTDIILDLVTTPSLPVTEYSPRLHGHMEDLAKIVHMMAELKPHLVLPVLGDRMLYACDEFKRLTRNPLPKNQTMFDSFIRQPELEDMDTSEDPTGSLKNGTYVTKCLMAINCLSQVFAEVFNSTVYSTRQANFLFGVVNLADVLADLCHSLGDVSAYLVRDAIIMQQVIPESWVKATKPNNFSTGDDEVDQILRLWDGNERTDTAEVDDENIKTDQETAAFRNIKALRVLLLETPAAIAELLGAIGHGIVGGRRKPDTMTRQKTDMVAQAIAKALLQQIQPSFITNDSKSDTALDKAARYRYLVAILVNFRVSIQDDTQGVGAGEFCQTYILKCFKDLQGLKCLRSIGEHFFADLKQVKHEDQPLAASAGLKLCLDIFDIMTTSKVVMNAPQSVQMKTSDPEKAHYFVPAQLLLEFRMEAMPLVRSVWMSDFVESASRVIVHKLISILKHVLQGDSEEEAVRTQSGHPKIKPPPARKFSIDAQRLKALTNDGYDEDLMREAVYRTNSVNLSASSNSLTIIKEYYEAYRSNSNRRRLPIPAGAVDLPPGDNHSSPTPQSGSSSQPLTANNVENVFRDILSNDSLDSEMEDVSSSSPTSTARPQTSTSSAMDISNILNHEQDPEGVTALQLYSVDSITATRDEIRSDLAEQCNNVLNTHQAMVFDLSDLVISAAKKLSDAEAKIYWESTSTLLVNSLLSMQAEGTISEAEGKQIAAAAHLIALLIQDKEVFRTSLGVFQESFEGMLSFLRLNVNHSRDGESSYPWIAPILLLIEQMLSQDNEPAEVKWDQPRDLDAPLPEAQLTQKSIVSLDEKKELFTALIDCLPRVGKDKSMALSIARVLVMLTRKREIALMLGEKRNLQRLFLMVKQLGIGVSSRFLSSFMLILRHIVEDDEVLAEIMRSEIQAAFSGRNATRQLDSNGYVRELHHLVIRSPEIFVKVSNDMLKFTSWSPGTPGAALALKETAVSTTTTEKSPNQQQEDQAAASVENDDDAHADDKKQKSADIKPPVVDNPDGVIQFLLSELLTYKDVEDKDVPSAAKADAEDTSNDTDVPVAPTIAPVEISSSSSDDEPTTPEFGKPNKPRFKAEEHPMFMYRCFLLQCLVELLHSYNRTKLEFINFTRKSDTKAATPSKPRSGLLNYVLNALVASGYVDKDENSIHCKKRLAVSDWAIKVLVALCSKTGEKGKSTSSHRYSVVQINDNDDEPDLTFVRRFVLEHAIKAFKDATSSTESLQTKYSKLLCLSDMFNRLLSKPSTTEGAAGAGNNSYKVLGRMMFEKNLISVLTSSLAEIDLSQTGARRVIKFILRPLQELTSLATQLSLTSPELITSVLGTNSDDDISSASSVSEVEDEREETPDLYRNSTLGLLDRNRDQDSDSDGEEEDGDEEMYDEEEEYADEMEYDDGVPLGQEDDDAVSDEEDDEHGPGRLEGLPGDVPMDIEFVVDGGGMDLDTGDDDTEDDSDDDDSDDSDDDGEEDGEDFEIEGDDGEINGDNEGDSLADDQEHDDGWEDAEDEDEEDAANEADEADEDHEAEVDADLLPEGVVDRGALQGIASQLFNAFQDPANAGDRHLLFDTMRATAALAGGQGDDEEDPDAAEEDEDMDENDAIEHEHFDDFMDGDVEDEFYEHDWSFEEPASRPPRGFARRGGTGQLPRSGAFRPQFFSVPPFRGDPSTSFIRRPAGSARRPGQDNDDGTNPLLQRPANEPAGPSARDLQRLGMSSGIPLGGEQAMFDHYHDARADLHAALNEHGRDFLNRHNQIFDLIARNIPGTMGSRSGTEPWGIHLSSNNAPVGSLSARFGLGGSAPTAHRLREDPPRAVNFTPATTMTRWQEERAILFGNQYLDKVQRVQIVLMSILAPLAQQEEKERRRKHEEEAEAQRQENERQRIEEERLRKEQEEREEAERIAEEERRLAAEAAAAAAEGPEVQIAEAEDETVEPMEGVQSTEPADSIDTAQPAAAEAPAQNRVFATIRGRELDITGLDIDREYLDALPEELREEVILQQLSARREEAQQPRATTGAEPEVDAGTRTEYLDDFMNALPEELREEVRQAEAMAQRQRDRETARREAAASAGRAPQAEDMNADDFFATLDPALRRVILSEQPQEILDRLDPRHAAEGREHGRRIFHYTGLQAGREAGGRRGDGDGQRDNKRQVVQLVDKAGVATLLRLMFLPQQGSLRSNLWHILRNVCGNRQTRFEVISMILAILKEGSIDIGAVERSLASLSLRAKATAAQKTPQPLKRTLSIQPAAGLSEEMTPLVVVQQCLSALKQLSQHGLHVRTLFLREVDISSSAKSKKGKEKESKTSKYPVNDLITLLERRLIIENASSLQSLAELLSAVTSPLMVLMRKEKEQQQAEDDKPKDVGEQSITVSGAQRQDTAMTEVPDEAPAETALTAPAVAAATVEAPKESDKPSDVKAKKPFEPPVIPDRNLQLIVGIFVAPECGNDTFHATLDTMSNVAHIPGANEVFAKQLVHHVQALSQSLCNSLTEFLPQLREAQSSTDLHGIISTHFSQSGSDQVKLLHVLKALDYLSEPKKDEEKDKAAAKSILTASYDSLTLGPLWSKLSECLTVMGSKDNAIAFASILLPLIESLMVVCKNTSLKEAPLAQQLREEGPTTPIMEELNDLEKLFFNFTTEHRKILNDIIRQSPKLMQGNGSFSLLAKNPKVLDFDNKRAFFTKQIHSRLHQQRNVQPPLQLNIRRDQVFQDSYKALYFKSADEMKYGKLNIRFNGEEGVDAGGVTREWFQVLARGIFNPDWALWQPVASDKTTFHPNSLSWINGEHLVYFKFIGRIIGKALHEGRVLDCHFSRAVYKRMLGKQPNLKDLESMDLDYYKSLVWILENDITDIITEDFSIVEEQFGEAKVVDLIENGRNIPVTEENKRDYIQKLVEYRLTGSVSEQLDHFIRGFHDIIPAELVSIFDEQELELLISGLPEIDVDDWKANTEYHNYNVNSPQITWFWRIVRAMSNEERAKLLQFITGTSKVPLNGFKDLEGMQGTTRFSIHREPSLHRLPTSHTCFNQLDLPAYDNQENLKTNLMKAINLGADYFGFA